MADYVTRLRHFTFKVDDGSIVVTSERDDNFKEEYSMPEHINLDDDDVERNLYNEFYMEVRGKYNDTLEA